MIHRRLGDPQAEPVSLADARMQLRGPDPAFDGRILQLISAARRMAEEATNRALAPQAWAVLLDAFPRCSHWRAGADALGSGIRLPAPPVAEITSVRYVDATGVQRTLSADAWVLDADSEPGWLFPAPDTTWPDTRCGLPNAVRIELTCGYPQGQLPQPIREWVLLHVAAWFENPQAVGESRLATMPYVDALLQPYRVISWSD